MRLDRYIASELGCSAYTVRCMLARRDVRVNGVVVTVGATRVTAFCQLEAAGKLLQDRKPLYLMLNKPPGYVSATQDVKHPTVLDLIAHPQKQSLHLAGRLDFNTTGLLLLTNDSGWSRNIMAPESKVAKTYWVQTEDEITDDYVAAFAQGFYFGYEDLWTQPAFLQLLGSHTALLRLYEGRYHQVKRMFGRFNNAVTALHRAAIGDLVLDKTLAPAAYRELSQAEVDLFRE